MINPFVNCIFLIMLLLFMFLLMPVVLAGYCFYKKNPKNITSIFIGVMSSILLCAFKTFFLYAHRVVPYTVGKNITYFLIRQTLLPVVVLIAVLFIISRDTLDYKKNSVFSMLLSFYMIYLPYSIITTAEGLYSAYAIFLKPVIFTFMIIQVSYCIFKSICYFENKKYGLIIPFVLLGLVYLIVPAIIEAYVIIDEKLFIQVLLILFYCLGAICSCSFSYIKQFIKK